MLTVVNLVVFIYITQSFFEKNDIVSLLNSIMNSSKFNLKCRVFECDNTKTALYTEPFYENGFSLTEYYRTKANS